MQELPVKYRRLGVIVLPHF